jgi:hypothetical protein
VSCLGVKLGPFSGRKNSDKLYFRTEVSYEYLNLKHRHLRIKIRKVHNEELCSLRSSTGIIGNKNGGRGEWCAIGKIISHRILDETKKLQRSIWWAG